MIASTNKIAGNKGLMIQGFLLLIFLLALGITFNYIATATTQDKEYIRLAGEQRVLSQRIVKDAVEASSANVEAFKQLKLTKNGFEQNLTYLNDGNPEKDLPPTPAPIPCKPSR